VFKSRAFTAGSIIGIVTGFGLYGTSLMLPLYFQNVLGLDATMTGLALLPGAIATAASMPLAGRLSKFLGARWTIAIGLILFAVGCWTMGGLNTVADMSDTYIPRAIQGFGIGFIFVPLTTVTLSEISRAKMASATGVYTLVRQLGGSIGIAILQFYETRREDSSYASLATGMTASNPALANLMHGAQNQSKMLMDVWSQVMAQAQAIAYDDVFRLCAIVFLASIPTLFFLRAATPQLGAPAEAPIIE
jgi:DHA2 family multidrug resistance protein